ncbi:MAG: glucose 1-dehydrogenase [Nitrospinaceae bacterium]|jgi:NAD(P)-dependent dehydrogenase (short-subunit alcohol dehydrogenase family)|nr:glucose 1-dehydrogenase [Nitrospinaceae bacterium]MBT3432983.1 glucose 1-dehydrogenase [Nitrospinaceae bacterium]MBT4431349.1 glucose 1-dehydrogenase [Nitrospinaceae bacterium]MBT5368300.1 glucose 1-dehydrogenase [Nitrospinaceae bacterium]MBT6394169.1 glucose 1-dehydrogenase [Nitrospinaceae bacterium]
MILDKFKLDGKVALVTGAGSGLGQAMAVALAEAGADVALAGRRVEALAETEKRISATGRRVLAVSADVSKSEDVKKLVSACESKLGPIDILVNGAGVFSGYDTVALAEDEWRRIIDINLTGTFLCCQAVGEGMFSRGRGSIINIATFLGDRAQRPARAAYNASKGGVAALSRALSVEWGTQGVRVNCISPGAHRTPMLSPGLAKPGNEEWLNEKTILGRVGEPEDIAGLCVFLASEASGYITGVNIYEDGGGWS